MAKNKIKKTYTHTQEEWLAFRREHIGGSDAGIIMGTNPYRSAISLWGEKTGRLPGFGGNGMTALGTYLEPYVAERFTERTGKKVRNENATMVNDDYPWASANIDRRIIGERALLECKTTGDWEVIRQCREGDFPTCYRAQCIHYLAVTGLDRVYLAVLDRTRGDFWVFCLERDEQEIEKLMLYEEIFWKENVLPDVEPPADGSKDAAEALGLLYGDSAPGEEINLSGVMGEVFDYITAKQEKADAEKEMRFAENTIKQAMKDAEIGYCGDITITWKTAKNGQRRFLVKEGA